MPRPKKDDKVKRAVERSTERALREERLALGAITKVFLLETPDPARVLARLDAMVRAADANPRTTPTIRHMLLDAVRYVRAAIERETGRPQSLFDPHIGHTPPAAVDALVAPTDGNVQLGLVSNESVLGDVEEAHEQRVQTITQVHEALVELLRGPGAATDRQLHGRYVMASAIASLPPQSAKAIAERRRELTAAGRVVTAGRSVDGDPLWDIVERDLLQEKKP